ncbi:MAG: VWA domain-containing protein, partial [Thermoplasmata archaeon]
MTHFLRIVKVFSVIFMVFMISNMALNISLIPISTVEASTINVNTKPSNGNTISGNYTFKVDDQGDSDRCEFYIDGLLMGGMKSSSGSWDWEETVGTYAWPDGWHVIRFHSIGGATGDDNKTIYVKFDNNAPEVTNVQTIYPQGQTASKPGDTVTIVATVSETTSGINEVICDTSYFSSTKTQVMYDDGNHLDGLSGDGTYGTPMISVTNELIGYHPVYINASDNAGNYKFTPGEVGIDTIDPMIEDVNVVYPKGQFSAKDSDQVRVTAYINDEDPHVDIVLDIDRSGSMGWTEDHSWTLQEIDISDYADNTNQLNIRFSYQTDFSWQFSGWNIDDVRLVSTESPSGFYYANFENNGATNLWTLDGGSEWERNVQPQGLGGTGYGYPDPTQAHGGNNIMGVAVTAPTGGNYNQNVPTKYATSPLISCLSQSNILLQYYRWLNCDYPGTAPDFKPSSNTGDEHTIQVKNSTGGWVTVWDNKQQKIEDAKEAAKILIDHQSGNDRSALYSFGDDISSLPFPDWEVSLNQSWTSNKTQMYEAIDDLIAWGSTPLWNSVVESANYAGTSETLKALVVLTDGSNTAGTRDLDDAIRAVKTNEVPTFTIALGTNSTEPQLKALANAYPGGSYYFAASSDQLDDIYKDISKAIDKIRFPKGAIITYVNATELGGLSKVLMYDDGNHEDFLPDDNIYGSELITISTGGETGMIGFKVEVEDVAGRTDTALGTVKVDNSIISIANATVIYPGNKTNVRDDEDIVVTSNIYDPHGVFPPTSPNGILSVYLDASNIGASSHIDLFDDGNHSDNETNDGIFGTKPITVTTGYSIGTYIITLYALDNATNTASQQINVRVDNSGPTSCNLLWPIDNTTLEDTVKFMATAYDDAGIKLVEIEVAESGIWDIMNFNENSGSYEIYFDTKTLSDGGPYKIKVRAFDNSGDDPVYDALSFGFFVDNTEPILNINAPRNGDFVDGQYEIN